MGKLDQKSDVDTWKTQSTRDEGYVRQESTWVTRARSAQST